MILEKVELKDIIKIASGEMNQVELASKIEVHESKVSKEMKNMLTEAVNFLNDKYKDMEGKCKALQNERKDLTERCNSMEGKLKLAQDKISKLQDAQTWANELEEMNKNLEESAKTLKDNYNSLQEKYNQWLGQILPLRALSSKWAMFGIALCIISFDGYAIVELLKEDLGSLSYALSGGLCFGLLAFTSNGNRLGRDLAIGVALVSASLYFDLLNAIGSIWKAAWSGHVPEKIDMTHLFYSVIPALMTYILTDILHPGLKDSPSFFTGWKLPKIFKNG